jgi:hypothetical protein
MEDQKMNNSDLENSNSERGRRGIFYLLILGFFALLFAGTAVSNLFTGCTSEEPEPVTEAPKVEVKKETLSPDQIMQKTVELVKDQGSEGYSEGNKSVKKWTDLNSWEFVKPFHDKYLFTTSYEDPVSRSLLPVGNPYHPEYEETVFLFEDLKNEGCKIFVPNNAIAYWGTYSDKNGVKYYVYDPAGKELPKR